MSKTSSEQWLLYLVRGVFAMLFGIMTLVIPSEAFVTLVVLLGAFMIADGLLSVLFSPVIRNKKRSWRWVLLISITGVFVAILTFFNPFIAVLALLSLFVLWSIFSGLSHMFETISFKGRRNEGWYVTSVLLCILIAMLIFINPFAGTITLSLVFGLYALATGILFVLLALRYRNRSKEQERKKYHRVAH